MSGLGMGFLTSAYGSQQKIGQPQLRPGDILVVIHDFNARSSDELTLRKSEKVELIELDEDFGDGWYLGRHLAQGGTGLFPGVYTTRAPPTPNRPMPPQALHRSSHSPPTSNYSNNPLSPIPPSPAGYQHSEFPPNPVPRATSQYSPAFVYDSPRASLPASYSAHAPSVQRSISQTLGDNRGGEDSPVMNETLSVIDEHITDLSTPRQSVMPQRTIREDSESDYSSRMDQQSYIAGPETDDEENGAPSEVEVRKWDHKQTAEHLRAIGVDPKHCDIFEEQEISGDVLLDMDQGFIYMKEYDFGVMGRRLKTWHKVRDFQNEVKRNKMMRQNTLPSVDGNSSIEDVARTQGRLVSTAATLLPRIPSLKEKPGLNIRQSHQSSTSHEDPNDGLGVLHIPGGPPRPNLGGQTPPSPWRASMIADTSGRPSAAMVRELSHSRRHSSIDFGKPPDLKLSASPSVASSTAHQKQPSLDRDWSMSASTLGMTASPTPTSTPKELHSKSPVMSTPPIVTNLDPDLERGYFSGNEIENRKQRNILRKRDSGGGSAMHSRQSSANNMAMKRHSRLASADSIRDMGPQAFSPASKSYAATGYKGRFRSSSSKGSMSKSLGGEGSPAVTNLESGQMHPPPRVVSSGTQPKISMQNKARKLIGMRAASETTTNNEKTVSPADQTQDSARASPVASPTGSTTPSGTSRSMELEGPEAPSKLNDVQGLTLPKAQARTRPKAKQETSAYQRGLLKITPAEARKNCDYHGWMKKKSSSLVTTWKPRLFILRGRRLSYYYAETDTMERGIIDISGHKVLVANSDAMVTLHAQITGATSTASPKSLPSSTEPSPTLVKSPEPGSASPFYFKLVPPKSGMSRAVQFTKPTIHFFQVDSIDEGRKWMGEIMKATIEHDLSSYETTNKQKTISLAKARARRERPPALKEAQESAETEPTQEDNKENIRESGLNIQGLEFADSSISLELTAGEKGRQEASVQRSSGTNAAGSAPEAAASHTP